MAESIKIINGSVDEWQGSVVIRGVISPDSLERLKVAEYQREILPQSKLPEMIKAIEQGKVPDVELGVRGGDFTERNGVFFIKDDTYIIDGLQRVSAARRLAAQSREPHLGTTIHFNTTEEWERARFRVLNADRSRLSPNVHLRNLRHNFGTIDLLYLLSGNPKFILHSKVTWTQQAKRGDLISAMTLCKVVGMLHSHWGPGRFKSFKDAGSSLTKCCENVGASIMRENTTVFFALVDECWGIKDIAYAQHNPQIKGAFLLNLARVFSDHEDFWENKTFRVSRPMRNKLKLFKVGDPAVERLAGTAGKSQEILYQMFIEHINSGKRVNHLKPWDRSYRDPDPADGEEENNEEQQEE